jgi:hypothetical protein
VESEEALFGKLEVDLTAVKDDVEEPAGVV